MRTMTTMQSDAVLRSANQLNLERICLSIMRSSSGSTSWRKSSGSFSHDVHDDAPGVVLPERPSRRGIECDVPLGLSSKLDEVDEGESGMGSEEDE